MTGGVADEVEVVGAGWAHGGSEGGEAGIGDGPGGQAGVFVSVIGRWRLEVGGVDGAAPAIVEQGGVDDGGVGGQGDALGEAVDEDACYQGALRVLANLFFNERGHDDGMGNVVVEAELGGCLAEAAHHGGEDLERCGVAGELIGVGEEIAFERYGGRSVGGEGRDELGVLALGGEEGVPRGRIRRPRLPGRCRRCCSLRGW